MDKYIIKNCEAMIDLTTINNVCSPLNCCCELVDDCLLKRIVEKTKKYINDELDFSPEELLSMFEIEECEE